MKEAERMVEEIRGYYGLDSPLVFKAMLKVPREEFVLPSYRHLAYSDSALPIGHGQTISQPYTVAFMTHLALGGRSKSRNKVLEVGTGSGYQAAILSKLFKEVHSIEIIGALAKEAKKRIKRLGYKNIFIKKGNGEFGWEEAAPFDAILITAGLENRIPQPLKGQLKVGGRLIVPLGEGEDKKMVRLTKLKSGEFRKEKFGIFHFVPFVREN
jgi:protein-L-isoaspartate(D-aspartate) O-methyltransferase